MYIIRKAIEYFFPVIPGELCTEALSLLDDNEKKIFMKMAKYDRKHSLEVYKKVRENGILKNEILYKKLALLHDCGKGNTNVTIRVLHKINIKTSLKKHPDKGAEKLEKTDKELAVLIKNHHVKNYGRLMDEFQKLDDLS
ncbi:HD domain-containing protein [Sebaldella sp. S0638]|uniref:HD domain-containing protein n=1 Tax=Sebaldella sp. S0638 TaxID=2957809 RepID=UPI0020A19397|nr:HD domain-containing protein [Sebaldella sp. S0638]MCP1223826.1 HD domain-containing protein [Sebaldella sp. S0638]